MITRPVDPKPEYLEFFAGGGLARLGLGEGWRCAFANDICPKKAASYRANFPPAREFAQSDIHLLQVGDIPGRPFLAWASFPCQDLSLAGARDGLKGERSGTFWEFMRLVQGMIDDGRRIPAILLENVTGALSSNGGRDFAAIMSALSQAGYRAGALVIDAVHFVPQSRPRLFVLAVREGLEFGPDLVDEAGRDWRPPRVFRAHESLPPGLRNRWVWWRLPRPRSRRSVLADLVEWDLDDFEWHTTERTNRLLEMMSDRNRERVDDARRSGERCVGAIYKRTRPDGAGGRRQRAEVRFDGVSGCLRTPAGGSSRQELLFVEGDATRSRLLAPREAARLMGAPERYVLPANYNEAYHLMGDAVVVPVVEWVRKHLLDPLFLAHLPAREPVANNVA